MDQNGPDDGVVGFGPLDPKLALLLGGGACDGGWRGDTHDPSVASGLEVWRHGGPEGTPVGAGEDLNAGGGVGVGRHSDRS